jgi:DNA-binding PadR family transcriptional regulator
MRQPVPHYETAARKILALLAKQPMRRTDVYRCTQVAGFDGILHRMRREGLIATRAERRPDLPYGAYAITARGQQWLDTTPRSETTAPAVRQGPAAPAVRRTVASQPRRRVEGASPLERAEALLDQANGLRDELVQERRRLTAEIQRLDDLLRLLPGTGQVPALTDDRETADAAPDDGIEREDDEEEDSAKVAAESNGRGPSDTEIAIYLDDLSPGIGMTADRMLRDLGIHADDRPRCQALTAAIMVRLRSGKLAKTSGGRIMRL